MPDILPTVTIPLVVISPEINQKLVAACSTKIDAATDDDEVDAYYIKARNILLNPNAATEIGPNITLPLDLITPDIKKSMEDKVKDAEKKLKKDEQLDRHHAKAKARLASI